MDSFVDIDPPWRLDYEGGLESANDGPIGPGEACIWHHASQTSVVDRCLSVFDSIQLLACNVVIANGTVSINPQTRFPSDNATDQLSRVMPTGAPWTAWTPPSSVPKDPLLLLLVGRSCPVAILIPSQVATSKSDIVYAVPLSLESSLTTGLVTYVDNNTNVTDPTSMIDRYLRITSAGCAL